MVAVDAVEVELKVEFWGSLEILRLVVTVIVAFAIVDVDLISEVLLSFCCFEPILAMLWLVKVE